MPARARDPFTRAALDASELLDVDVDQLARPRLLIATRGLKPKTPQATHPFALEDRRDRRGRSAEHLGDLRPRETQLAQRADHLNGAHRRLGRLRPARRTAIQQARSALSPPPRQPLAARSLTDP